MAGDITGVRAFRVDSLGRLTGYTHRTVFKPGINEAACERDSISDIYHRMWQVGGSFMPSPAPPAALSADAVKSKRSTPEHTVAGQKCSCGFYAYVDGSNDYAEVGEPVVTGIIRGTGVCTVGSRGFRASKAELVALVMPSRPRSTESLWHRFCGRVARNGAVAVGFALPAFILSLSFGLVGLGETPWAALLFIISAISAIVLRASFVGIDVELDRKYGRNGHGAVTAEQLAMVRRNYPDVPVYGSLSEAKAAHPITQPEPVTPETVEDFWTREATR